MKEIEVLQKDKISIYKQQEQKKELKLYARLLPNRGHILYEINTKNLDIQEASFNKTDIHFTKLNVKKSVIMKEDCFYISALNKKNAMKKYNKI